MKNISTCCKASGWLVVCLLLSPLLPKNNLFVPLLASAPVLLPLAVAVRPRQQQTAERDARIVARLCILTALKKRLAYLMHLCPGKNRVWQRNG